MGKLDGKAALVSGGAQGIGAAIARALAAEGASVLIGDIDRDQGAARAREIGPNACAAALDVTDAGSWTAAVAEAETRFGQLSILVNNAGIIIPGLISDVNPADWRRVIEVNLTGVFLGMQAALPALKRAGQGAILNVSSSAGLVGYANRAPYVASKWGVRGLTKTAALEFAQYGIRVNSIHPGPIRTPLTAHYPDSAWAAQAIPRFGEAEEVARMAVFIVAEASYSTASEFVVDGGVTAGPALRP